MRRGVVSSFWADMQATLTAALQLFRTELRSKHRRAVLGYIWLVLPGIAVTFAFSWLRQSELFVVRDTAIPYPLFVLSGLFMWQTFIDGLSLPMRHTQQYWRILSCVQVPHAPVLAASLLRGVLDFVIRMTLVGVLAIYFGTEIATFTGTLAAFVVIFALGWGIGLCILPFSLLYDDIGRLITLGSLFGIFVCPIAFQIPSDSPLAYNPLIPLFNAARSSLNASMESGDLLSLFIGFGIAWLLSFVGAIAYRRSQPHLTAAIR